jgi:microcystin-dependent protein
MAFFNWSLTPASNGIADPTINYAEGMAPSALNDSARAMMARLKEWGNDISGKITTAGTSTAYTVTSAQGFDSLAHMDGAMLAFLPHTTNGATVTLNVDGLGAKPLRSAPSVELPSGVMAQGTPYVATYVNADGAWYLQGFVINPYNIPIGGMMDYIGSSAPNSSFVLPFGQAISRTTYATLFSLVSTTYGTGDGSTTFNVPDLRGRATFGLDNMGGSAANRITVAGLNYDGTSLGNTGGSQQHTLSTGEMPAHNHGINDSGHYHGAAANNSGASGQANPNGNIPGEQNTTTFIYTNSAGNCFMAGGAGGSAGGFIQLATTGITTANNGSGGAHTIMPPSMVVAKILRII